LVQPDLYDQAPPLPSIASASSGVTLPSSPDARRSPLSKAVAQARPVLPSIEIDIAELERDGPRSSGPFEQGDLDWDEVVSFFDRGKLPGADAGSALDVELEAPARGDVPQLRGMVDQMCHAAERHARDRRRMQDDVMVKPERVPPSVPPPHIALPAPNIASCSPPPSVRPPPACVSSAALESDCGDTVPNQRPSFVS